MVCLRNKEDKVKLMPSLKQHIVKSVPAYSNSMAWHGPPHPPLQNEGGGKHFWKKSVGEESESFEFRRGGCVMGGGAVFLVGGGQIIVFLGGGMENCIIKIYMP